MEMKKPKRPPGFLHVPRASIDDIHQLKEHGSQSHLLPSPSANPIVKPSKPQSPRRTWMHLTQDTWFNEVFLMVFSFFAFLAIIVVLAVYDHRPVPDFKYGLKLNTIISILAIASKSSLIFVVSASIGQLKWIWFQTGKRRLKSLQAFDEASRGPLGSISVLFSRPKRGHGLITLGAAVTILALAFEAFMQQILSYPIRQVDQDSSQASTKQNYVLFDYDEFYNGNDKGYMSAIYAGLWTNSFNMNPRCPSGNCTWPPFQSVGWCSQCEDITSQATLVNCSDLPDVTRVSGSHRYPCNVTIPQGSWASFPIRVEGADDDSHGNMIEVPWGMIWESGVYVDGVVAGVENPLFALVYAELNKPPIDSPHPAKDINIKNVTQCVLSPCTRTHSVSVSNGEPSIHLSPPDWRTITNYPGGKCDDNICWQAEYKSTASNITSTISFQTALNMLYDEVSYISSVYNLTGPFYTQTGGEVGDTIIRVGTVGLDTLMDNIAMSLTGYVLGRSNDTVYGTMSVSELYVFVEWGWITLPAIVLLSTMVLFISTVFGSRRHGLQLWRCAILPTMYHGLEKDILPDGPEYATVSQMRDMAKVPVELGFSGARNRLMFQRDST